MSAWTWNEWVKQWTPGSDVARVLSPGFAGRMRAGRLRAFDWFSLFSVAMTLFPWHAVRMATAVRAGALEREIARRRRVLTPDRIAALQAQFIEERAR